MAIVKFDINRFNKDIQTAFAKTMDEAIDKMQSQLTEPVREYPRTTIRQYGLGVTGRIATSPRDVADSLELINSLNRPEPVKTRFSINISAQWDAEHSELVYTGWQKINAQREITKVPPYPWITLALQSLDLSASFYRNYRKLETRA